MSCSSCAERRALIVAGLREAGAEKSVGPLVRAASAAGASLAADARRMARATLRQAALRLHR